MPPTTTYDIATVSNPTDDLTDFPLLIDLSRMSSEWWSAVDTSDGTRGRATTGDGLTDLPCDWINFDSGSETGLLRVRWSGTLDSVAAQQVRVYPPNTANSALAEGDPLGQHATYKSSIKFYWPGHDLLDRTSGSVDLTAVNGPTSGVSGKIGEAYLFDDALTQYLENTTAGPIVGAYPSSMIVWANFDDLAATQPSALCLGGGVGENDYFRLYYNSGVRSQINLNIASVDDNAGAVSVSTWNNIGTRLTSSEIETYLNGVGTGTPTAQSQTWSDLSDVAIGIRRVNSLSQHFMSGMVQHAFIFDEELPDAWFEQEYNQGNDQAAFWGTWTNVPASSGPTRRIILCS